MNVQIFDESTEPPITYRVAAVALSTETDWRRPLYAASCHVNVGSEYDAELSRQPAFAHELLLLLDHRYRFCDELAVMFRTTASQLNELQPTQSEECAIVSSFPADHSSPGNPLELSFDRYVIPLEACKARVVISPAIGSHEPTAPPLLAAVVPVVAL
jgi:hypothetical protein